MIDYINQNLFLGSSVHKELRITTDDGAVTITNEDLHQEKFELRESLCSETSLVFGSCEASSIKYTVSNIFGSLKGKWLNVSMILNHDTANPFRIGRYKVDSDVPTANRDHREVVAYDALHDVITAEVSKWYNTVLPNEDSTVTLKAFRDSFFAHFGIEQENVALPNDTMVVTKTIQPEELSGKTVIVAICEINGCFGNIGRSGKFRYVFLEQNLEGLYPSQTLFPSDTLFPQEPKTTFISNGTYIPPCKYESYNVQSLSGVLIRKEENDVGAQIGTEDNLYIVQDNFLVYGKSEEELVGIANNIFGRIRDIKYRPFNTKAKGNPCLEIGDAIRLSTKTDRIESYILTRTLTGIQSLIDDYTADGTEKQGNSVNTIRHAILELKNKSNVLTRTVDETRSEITDLDRDLRSTISQTAGKLSVDIENLKTETNTNLTVMDGRITAEVNRAENAEASLQVTANEIRTSVSNLAESTSTRFSQTDSAISAEVKRAGEAEASLQVSINGISSSVSSLESSTSTRFTQTDSAITAEVTRAKNAESSLSTAVNGKVGASDVSSMIASEVPSLIRVELGQITISSGQINLNGYFTANGDFHITESGDLRLEGDTYQVYLDADAGFMISPIYSSGYISAIKPGSIGLGVTEDKLVMEVIGIYKGSKEVCIGQPMGSYGYDFRLYGTSISCSSGSINSLETKGIDTIYINCTSINNGIPITTANLSSYIGAFNSSSTKISYTSVGNINIMSTDGYQAESGYKYGNIASTGWVQGKVKALNDRIDELEALISG